MLYSASVLFRTELSSKSSESVDEGTWEERIYLIKASGKGEANDSACTLSQNYEHSYIGGTGEEVKVIFDSVIYLDELEDQVSGGQLVDRVVFSRYLSKAQAESLSDPNPF